MVSEQINELGMPAEKKTVKVSRRDFPYALSQVSLKIEFFIISCFKSVTRPIEFLLKFNYL